MLTITFAALACLSVALVLWQVAVAFRFPLHRPVVQAGFTPSITVLKPLKGVDAELAGCLESWLTQRYAGEVEFIFGVASARDPACEVVRSLISRFPKAKAQLAVCPKSLGANAKVSTLIQTLRLARHEVIVVSDADVWVPEDALAQIVAPLQEPGLGLVNCFYSLAPGTTLAMRWEAFAVNADFWSQVLQSQSLKPIDFALGAVMATPRSQLDKIGGFEALADYLADDYQLGRRIARSGGRIAISPALVECRSSPMSWSGVWTHQLRWARTIRACQPLPYFFSQLQNGTLWPLLWAASHPIWPVLACSGAFVLTRMAAGFYCERKLTRRADFNAFWLAPMKDLLQIIIWALAFFGNRIEWRGQRFRLRRGGKLVEC